MSATVAKSRLGRRQHVDGLSMSRRIFDCKGLTLNEILGALPKRSRQGDCISLVNFGGGQSAVTKFNALVSRAQKAQKSVGTVLSVELTHGTCTACASCI